MPATSVQAKLRAYLRVVGKSQAQLAFELGIQPTTLSHKLNRRRGVLTDWQKKHLILALATWRALKFRTQATELLHLLDDDANLFSESEWAAPPLSLLRIAPDQRDVPQPDSRQERAPFVQPAQESGVPAQGVIWGETPAVPFFYGRRQELAQLTTWLADPGSRVVAVLGMGGVGKTALTLKAMEQVAPTFAANVWCSLRTTPLLDSLLTTCLLALAPPAAGHMPGPIDAKFTLLVSYLRQRRCLLVLDDFEALMTGDDASGHMLPTFAGYGTLINQLCVVAHQSCILVLSREKPLEFLRFEADPGTIQTLTLAGLDETAACALLDHVQLHGSPSAQRTLIQTYGGNPLLLKLVASHIRSLFGQSIDRFVQDTTPFFGDVRRLLHEQYDRLGPDEQHIVDWLAIHHEPAALADVFAGVRASRDQVLDALSSLQRRALIEVSRDGTHFTLQSVILEFVTQHMIATVSDEIYAHRYDRVCAVAVVQGQATEYIRVLQTRVFLDPMLARLRVQAAIPTDIEGHFVAGLRAFQQLPLRAQGYGPGNLVHLLRRVAGHLNGYDFSNLNLQQVDFQGVALQHTSLRNAHLQGATFSSVFSSVLAIAFNPTGTVLAVSDVQGRIRLWNVHEHTVQQVLAGHTDRVRTVAFSPDTPLLASGGDDALVRLWDTATGQCRATLHGHTDRVGAVAFQPGGSILATAGHDQHIRLWDSATNQMVRVLDDILSPMLAVAFHPTGTYFAGGCQDGRVCIWETDTWQLIAEFHDHTDAVTSLAFHPKAPWLATGSADHTVRVWHVTNGDQPPRCIPTADRVWGVAWSSDGTTLMIGVHQRGVLLWSMAQHTVLRTLHSEAMEHAWLLATSPDGVTFATGYENQMVKLWDVRSGQCLHTLHSYANRVGAVVFAPAQGLIASGTEDCRVRLWDSATETCRAELVGHRHRVWAVAFSGDGAALATGSQDQTIRLWNTTTWACTLRIAGVGTPVWAVSWNADSTMIASCGDAPSVQVWDATTGQALPSLVGHGDRVRVVAFHPHDAQILATGSDEGVVTLWQCDGSREPLYLRGHTGWIRSLAFSPNGSLLASGSEDGTLRLWQVTDGTCRQTLRASTKRIWSVAFSPDGTQLASSGQDATVRLWDSNQGHLLHTLTGHTGLVRSVAFGPTGQYLASGSEDETVRLWCLPDGSCTSVLRSPRLYEQLNIAGSTGISEALRADLHALGAVETNAGA